MTVTTSVKTKLLIRKKNGQTVSRNNTSQIGLTRSILNETKLGNVDRLAQQAKSIKIGVGFTNDIHPSSGGQFRNKGRQLTYAELAVILERGSSKNKIPPRPYLELSGKIVAPRLRSDMDRALRRIMNTKSPLTREEMLRNFQPIANKAARQTKKIIKTRSVPVVNNADMTLELKSPERRPWIRTGQLVNNLIGTAYISNR